MRDLILVLAFIAPIALAALALAVVRSRRRARSRRAVRERAALTLAGCCCHRAGSPHACRNPNPPPKSPPPLSQVRPDRPDVTHGRATFPLIEDRIAGAIVIPEQIAKG